MPSVDNRVVNMRIDKKEFEAGINGCIDSLERLKRSLKLKDAAKGFDDLDRAAKNSSSNITRLLEGISKTLNNRFSFFGTLKNRFFNDLISQAQNAAGTVKNLISSMSVDQITAGWDKYNEKTTYVQTIMNATGDSIDTVNGYLDKLMWFSDETSYGFNDMVSAVASMTSTGGDIKELIPLIEGFANAVAFAGKGPAEFSRLMSTAITSSYGMGYLTSQDFRQMKTANVASKQLIETFINTGEALGKIQEGEVTLEKFTESLNDKWADTEVMEKAFGYFAEMTEKAYELVNDPNNDIDTATEAYAYLADQYDTVSIRAALAAQEAKTFQEAIDATKDAVSSKWQTTWEYIFGNYEEAKDLWTWLSEELWSVFAEPGDNRNDIFKLWHNGIEDVTEATSKLIKIGSGLTSEDALFEKMRTHSGVETALTGYQMFIESLHNMWDGILGLIDRGKDIFSQIIPPLTYDRLMGVTEKFYEFSQRFKATFATIEEIIDPVVDGVTEVSETLSRYQKTLENLDRLVEEVNQGIWGNGEERRAALEEEGFMYELVQNGVNELLHDSFRFQIQEEDTADAVGALNEAMANPTVATLVEEYHSLKGILDGVVGTIDILIQFGKALWKQVLLPVLDFANQKVLAPILGWLGGIGEKIAETAAYWKEINLFEETFKLMGTQVKDVGKHFSNFYDKLKKLPSVTKFLKHFDMFKDFLRGVKQSALDSITNFLNGEGFGGKLHLDTILDGVASGVDWLLEKLNALFSFIEGHWSGFTKFFDNFSFKKTVKSPQTGYAISDFLSSIFSDKKVKESSSTFFSNIWGGLKDSISSFDISGITGALSGKFNELWLSLTGIKFGTPDLKSINITQVLGAIFGILIKIKRLGFGLSVIEFIHSLAQTIASFKNIPAQVPSMLSAVTSTLRSLSLQLKATAVLEIAIAIGILASSLAKLSGSDIDAEKLYAAAWAIGIIVGAIALLISAISKLKAAGKGSDGLNIKNLTNTISDNLSHNSLTVFGKDFIQAGKDALIAATTAYKTAANLIGFAIALGVVVGAFKTILDLVKSSNMEDLKYAFGILAQTIGGLIVAMAIIGYSSKGINSNFLTLISFALSMKVLIMVLDDLCGLIGEDAKPVYAALDIMMKLAITMGFILTVLGAVSEKIGNVPFIKIGLAFIMLASSIGIVTGSMKVMESMDPNRLVGSMQNVLTLIVVMAAVLEMLSITSGIGGGNKFAMMGLAFIEIAAAMSIMVGALKLMEFLDQDKLVGTVVALGILMIAMGALAALAGRGKGGNAAKGFEIMEMATAIVLLAAAFRLLNDVDADELKSKALTIGLFIAALAVIGAFVGKFEVIAKGMQTLANILLTLGAAFALVGVGALAFAAALVLIGASADSLKGTGAALAEEVVGFFDVLMEKGQSIFAFITGLLMAILPVIFKSAITNAITQGAGALIGSKAIIIGALAILLAGVLEYLGVEVGPIVDAIGKLILIIINDLAIFIMENGEAIGNAIMNVAGALGVFLLNALKGIFGGLFDAIADLAPQSGFAKWWNGMDEFLDALTTDSVENVKKSVEVLEEGFKGSVDEFTSSAKTAVDNSNAELSNAQLAAVALENQQYGAGNTTADYVKQEMDATASALDTSLTTIVDKKSAITEVLSSLGSDLSEETINSIADNMSLEDVMEDMTAGGVEGLLAHLSELTGAGQQVGSETTNAIAQGAEVSSPSRATIRTGMYIDQGLANGIRSYVGLVRGPVALLVQAALEGLNNIQTQTFERGRWFVEGFVNGIDQNKYLANDKVQQMAMEALQTLDATMNSHSPSREAMQRGRWFDQGFAIGIGKDAHLVDKSITNMGENALAGINDVVTRIIDAINGNFDMDPTIRPVLDLSEIQNGASRIGSMFGGYGFSPNLSYARTAAYSVNRGYTAAQAPVESDSYMVVEAIREMRGDIAGLQTAITGMQVVMNNGALVGQISPGVSNWIDRNTTYKKRGM